jgi:fatty acyl-CoA reductase
MMIGAAKGVIRSMHCNPDLPSESIPVDININCIIALAYKRSLIEGDNVYYCNISDNGDNPLTWKDSIELGKKLFYEYPMSIALWYPNGSIKSNYYVHLLCVIFFHYLPAYIIDFLLFITGNKPFLVDVQKRVSQGLKVLQYYTTRPWIFKNDNFKKLYNEMNDVDKEKFYCDLKQINYEDYILNYILGTRQYILKESPDSLPKARKTLKR